MNPAIVHKLEAIYKRLRKPIADLVFPLILLLWPLVKVCIGVDTSDSTYSLGNYLYPDNIQPMWKFSTYLSGVIGSGIVRLPGGSRLLVANIYMGLIVSAIVLICYYALRADFTSPVMFAGEFLAINFCWIPCGILYNYLTYLFFTGAAILIYYAITRNDDRLYMLAGTVLGLNLFIRIPNITEVALIIVVWVFALRKVRATLYAVGGYIIGAGIPFLCIVTNYGMSGITEMITGLTAISGGEDSYTPLNMVLSTLKAYGRSAKWLGIILAVVFLGTILFASFNKDGALKWTKRVAYIGVVAIMIRFFWGRGMFSFRYYEDYTAMYEWGMILLFMSWIAVLVVLFRSDYNIRVTSLSVIVLIILIITPLGSNNYTCQNLNNLFIVLPFTVYVIGGWMYRGVHRFRLEGVLYGCNFPWMSMVIVVSAMIVIQSTLFHVNFVFRDGMDGTPRDTVVTDVDSLQGMYTGTVNAAILRELNNVVRMYEADSVLLWGDCPGLVYILDKPCAIDSSWPSLGSYSLEYFESQLMQLPVAPNLDKVAIIIRDSQMTTFALRKYDVLLNFMDNCGFDIVYNNGEYSMYMISGESM